MRNADRVLDHERREPGAVHQHDALDRSRELDGLRREGCGREEDALVGAVPCKRAVERLDLGSADRVLPALGLDVDLLEAEAVERDEGVDRILTLEVGGFRSAGM